MRTGFAPGGRPWPRWAILYAATLTGCALALAMLCWRPFHTPARTFIEPPAGTRFEGLPAVSPDGRRIACALSANGIQSLWVMPLQGRGSRKLERTEGARMPFWSPDGRSVGFFTESELKVADAAGGGVRTLCPATGARGGAWSREGTIVFAHAGEGPLFRVPERGGTAAPLTTAGQAKACPTGAWPQFLLDGSLLYSAFSPGENEGELHIILSATGRDEALLRVPGRIVYTPASGGMLVYSKGSRLVFQGFHAARGLVLGTSGILAPLVAYSYADSARIFAVGPAQIVYRNGDPDRARRLVWVDRNSRNRGTIGEPARYALPRVSPDGSAVLVARSDAQGGSGIWLLDAKTGAARALTPAKAKASHPVWSPEGNAYYYEIEAPDGFRIARASLNGAGGEETVFSGDRQVYPMDASAWGILFARLGDGGYEVWGAPAHKEGPPRAVVKLESGSHAYAARLSPDGRWVALVAGTEEPGDYDVWVAPLHAAGQPLALKDCYRISSGGGFDPEWNPDGRELFYIDARGQLVSVEVQTSSAFQAGAHHVLFGFQGTEAEPLDYRPGFGYSGAPDGRRFLFNMRTAEAENELTVLGR